MITKKDVEHVAKLSRLEFSDDQKEDFTQKLNSIVEYVEQLEAVDVEDVKPTYHVLDIKNVFRKDEVKPSFERKEVVQNAPDEAGGCFRVPKVVE